MKRIAAIAAGITLAVTSAAPCINAAAEGSEVNRIAGDINLDGTFNISDLVLIQKYLLGSAEIKEAAYNNADMNGDKKVNVFDMCLFREKIVKGTEGVTQTIESSVTSDITAEGKNTAWSEAISGEAPQLITSSTELDKWLDGKFNSAVERSLRNTYNDEFFAANDLVLDLYAQSYRDDWYTVASAELTDGELHITYDRDFINGFAKEGLMITQVTIPKYSCSTGKAVSEHSWEEKTQLSYSEYCLISPSMKSLSATYYKEGEWVDSQEELDAYLADCLNEEGMELIGNSLKLGEKSAYVWVDSDIMGSTHALTSSYVGENTLTLNFSTKQPMSCEGEGYLRILYADKTLSGYSVKKRSFNFNDDMYRFDGEPVRFSLGDSQYRTLFINQYTFRDESSADLYLAYPGGGGAEFSKVVQIGSIELEKGFCPFDNNYTDDGGIIAVGDDFSISLDDDILKISCRTAEDSDFTEIEIKI